MTFDQAAAEISAAVQNDPDFNPAVETPLEGIVPGQEAPADQAPQPTPGEEAPPDEFASTESEDSFMGSDFNPDLLPEELQAGWKQLQGDYTRKTQELAEQRKQFESLGDVEQLKQAQEFFTSLRDPEYLKAFYKELGGIVQELDPEAAAAAAEPEQPAPVQLAPELEALKQSDPELSPFVDRFAQMEQRIAQFEAQAQADRQALAEERQMMADAYDIDQQVAAVREAHPDWGDDDMQEVYDRAVAYDGDIVKAAELVAANNDRIISSYLSRKQQAPAPPVPGGGVVSQSQPDEGEDLSYHERLSRADAAAEAYLAANDMAEFSG